PKRCTGHSRDFVRFARQKSRNVPWAHQIPRSRSDFGYVPPVSSTESISSWRAPAAVSLHDRILEAAGQLMADEGVDALRLERVARLAGCSRSSLYRYFDTKDALIIAVLRQRVAQMASRIRILLEGAKTPAEKIVQGVVRAVELARNDPQFVVMFAAPNSPTVMRIAASALPELITPVIDSILPEEGEESWFPE